MKRGKLYFYRNLHKQCWSMMYRGRVLYHPSHKVLKNVEFRVRQGGHAKAVREGRKNVHAFAITPEVPLLKRCGRKYRLEDGVPIAYIPFECRLNAASFVDARDGRPVVGAELVELTRTGKVVAWGVKYRSSS